MIFPQFFFAILFFVFTSTIYGQWTTSGTNITTTNKVGIGVDQPTQALEVNGTGIIGSGNWGAFIVDGKDKNDWMLNSHSDGESFYIRSQEEGGVDWAQIPFSIKRQTGNVGIGTLAPSTALQVNGKISITKADNLNVHNIEPNVNVNGTERTLRFNHNSITTEEGFEFYNQKLNNSLLFVRADGNIGVGTTTPESKLVVANGSDAVSISAASSASGIGFNREVTGGAIFDTSKSAWQFSARDEKFTLEGYNGAKSNPITILKNGNVGIGDSNPTQALEVNGTGIIGDGNWGAFIVDGKDKNDWMLNSHSDGESFYIRSQEEGGVDWAQIPFSIKRQTGNVGIGTLSPTTALQVNGKISITKENNVNVHNIEPNVSVNGGERTLRFNHNSVVTTEGFEFYNQKLNNSLLFVRADGNVGIGITTPEAKLEVNGDISNGGTDFVLGKLDGRDQGSNTRNRALVHNDGDRLEINFDGDFEGGTTMHGNVGIGTRNTDEARLTVAGNIHAREIKVTIDAGADFVFADNYDLPKLEDVAAFVKENKHLPQIAPAAIMEKEGLELGEMNIRLLQKVEELTLYTIEQSNQIKELINRLEKLESK